MNFALLEYEMKIQNITRKDIQNKLELSDSAISRKWNEKTQFTYEEIKTIIKMLKLDDKKVMDIFFRIEVS